MTETTQPTTVSIIIPAFNASRSISKCVHASRNQTWRGGNIETIVVDDGSTDDSAKLAREAGADLVLIRRRAGRGAARNAGIDAATGEMLLFVDADCSPASDFVERMVESFADPSVDGVKGAYRTRQRDLIARFVQIEYEDKYRRMVGRERIDFIDSYAAGYRRSVLSNGGARGFDTGLAAAEDVDLSFRLAQAGFRLVFNPEAFVYHQHRTSLFDYAWRKFSYGFWRAKVYRRHPSKIAGDSHTPPILAVQLPLASIAVLAAGLSIIDRRWLGLAFLGGAGFFASTVPFVLSAVAKDPAVTMIAPVMLAVRSLSLAAGLACGLPSALLYNRAGSRRAGGA